MKKNIFFILTTIAAFQNCLLAQSVGINSTGATPNASAALDVSSTNQGLLVPRVALTGTTDATTITSGNVTSMMVYNTATAGASPNNVVPGYYYWNGAAWSLVVTKTKIHVPIFGSSTVAGAANFYAYSNAFVTNITTPASVPYSLFGQVTNYIATTNGEQVSQINGWIWQASFLATSTANFSLYKYSPVSGTTYTTNLAGTLVGSVSVSLSNAANGVYSFTLTPTTPTTLNAGDVLILWLQSPNNDNYRYQGTLEILANPQ